MVKPTLKRLSVKRQCELLELPRSTCYYKPRPTSEEDLRIMRLIDEQFLKGERKL